MYPYDVPRHSDEGFILVMTVRNQKCMREYHRSGCYKPYRIKVAQPVRLNHFHASGTPSSKDAKSKPKKEPVPTAIWCRLLAPLGTPETGAGLMTEVPSRKANPSFS
jgi:hypothetical protein